MLKPRWIVIETVVHMRTWKRYKEFLETLESLGYSVRVQVLDASDFGTPQSRRRLFIICDKKEIPPEIVPHPRIKKKKVRDFLDKNGTYPFSRLWSNGRAKATLLRARRAMRVLGKKKPFLLVYYGTDGAGGWQTLDRPLRTVTTVDRFAYVRPDRKGRRMMRMLQPAELISAMGFPKSSVFERGTRRDKI